MNALEQIVARTRAQLATRRARVGAAELARAASARLASDPPRAFEAALAAPGLSVIAEHKRRSPSAGTIREDLALEHVVGAYERAGAHALSVLTETSSFGGALDDLGRARAASALPVLRKDFIVDAYQVVESCAAGADAILLIVAAVQDAGALSELYEQARELGLGVLVEIHDAAELATAAALGASVIGINNRDLTTLIVRAQTTFELLAEVPSGTTVVSESGWRERSQLARLRDAGVQAVLVGEALMRAADVEAACRELIL
ncbi:MAG: indole-3-glycerol phosphate synthase TrpC [Solirubrobacteraceae bacterium]